MKFKDIPQYTQHPNYVVDISFDYLEQHLSFWNDRGELELEPDFQRSHVWNTEQQIAYVEYLLKGGHAAQELYFNCKGWQTTYDGPIQLVDGLQRLTAVRSFLANKIPVFGTLYSEFEDKLRFTRSNFKFYINNLKTRKEVLQWYIDLNTGGVIHSSSEIDKVKRLLQQELLKERESKGDENGLL